MVKKIKNLDKKIDLAVITFMFIIIAFICLTFKFKPLLEGILYTLIPTAYMFLRKKKNYKKILLGTFFLGSVLGFIFDSIQYINKAWVTNMLIHWKFFGITPLDDVIGYTLMTLLIITFYEHFIDSKEKENLSKYFIWGVLGLLIALIIFSISLSLDNSIFKIPYSYFVISLIAIIFPIIFSIRHPKIIPKFLMTGGYFFFVWLTAEIVALKTNGWIFPGQYIGLITLFGVTFPLEEILFWMMWYAIAIVSYYEFLIDDQK